MSISCCLDLLEWWSSCSFFLLAGHEFPWFYVNMLSLCTGTVFYAVCFTVIIYSFAIPDLSGFGLVNIAFRLSQIITIIAGLRF